MMTELNLRIVMRSPPLARHFFAISKCQTGRGLDFGFFGGIFSVTPLLFGGILPPFFPPHMSSISPRPCVFSVRNQWLMITTMHVNRGAVFLERLSPTFTILSLGFKNTLYKTNGLSHSRLGHFVRSTKVNARAEIIKRLESN